MSAAIRQRRLRARQRAGLIIAPAPVSNELIATLIDTGWLPVDDSEDRVKVGEALARMANEMAHDHLSKIA